MALGRQERPAWEGARQRPAASPGRPRPPSPTRSVLPAAPEGAGGKEDREGKAHGQCGGSAAVLGGWAGASVSSGAPATGTDLWKDRWWTVGWTDVYRQKDGGCVGVWVGGRMDG